MITMVSLSRPLMRELSALKFMFLYTIIMIGGAIGYALLATTPHPIAGASGALFGLAGALVMEHSILDAREVTWTFAIKGIVRPLVLLVMINIVMYWWLSGKLAWQAHLAGFIAGSLIMGFFIYRRQNK